MSCSTRPYSRTCLRTTFAMCLGAFVAGPLAAQQAEAPNSSEQGPSAASPVPDARQETAGDQQDEAPAGDIVAVEEGTTTSAEATAPAAEEAVQEPGVAEADLIDAPQQDTEAAAALANEPPKAAAATQDAAAAAVDEVVDADATFQERLLSAMGAESIEEALDEAEVVEATDDRVVVSREGGLQVLKDDDALMELFGPTTDITRRRYDDGSTMTVSERSDGIRVRTVTAADGRVVRRTRIGPDDVETVLFDDTEEFEPVDLSLLEALDPTAEDSGAAQTPALDLDRGFSLQQVRTLRGLRESAPEVELPAVEFRSGSASIEPSQNSTVLDICTALGDMIRANPSEVFLVEGHSDATGSAARNLALSDQRAKAIATALVVSGDVPPENIVVQGYGESSLAVPTEPTSSDNRRVTVRRLTPLLQPDSSD